MSQFTIDKYHTEVEQLIHFGGTKKETAIRNPFYNLLNEYAIAKGLMVVQEVTIKATNGKNITPDGTLKDTLRQDWGYWESKDEADNIDEEIKKKFDKGYPKENILFEDSQTAVLFQNGFEKMRISMKDSDALDGIITAFIKFERPEVKNFREAITHFKEDIPTVTETLRALIMEQEKSNIKFNIVGRGFLKICHSCINPNVTMEDVREMIIQHILTEDIFNSIFGETQFHRENNIAHELENVIDTFFTGTIKRTALSTVKHYYEAINAAAASIADHHEKQKFLKVVYETFYKSYNPKAADRLGVVYTPNEVVRFMVESTDYLLHKHFNTFLANKGVDILDPATGTGTFICDIIDYIRKDKLEYKYTEELHANEIAILPYYISNLNIEYTYKQKTGKYKEFENLCFADTLDNILGLNENLIGLYNAKYKKTGDLFSLSTENTKRVNRQNSKKISVVIGNPPYNANQMNENENNKNREYPFIDQRIKDTFIKNSTAQKTKVYDMYARFYRWAFDRLDANGIIAFVTNRSFIDSRTFDGFRKCIQNDFDYAYIIDTKSDVRTNPKIAGTTHNIFGIQTGVAIMFLVHKAKRENIMCNIQYICMDDFWRKEEKLQWLSEYKLKDVPFDHIQPDKNSNWLNIADTDFESLMQLNRKQVDGKILVSKSFMGISTNRDEWVYDFNNQILKEKITFFINQYSILLKNKNKLFPNVIKWSRDLKNKFEKNIISEYNINNIIIISYRPFIKKYFYADKVYIDRLTANHIELHSANYALPNKTIAINHSSSKDFNVLASNCIVDLHYNGDSVCISLFRYDSNGNRIDNITDWGLTQFTSHYKKKKITKEDIFHYTYAVLHNPAYRSKYALNLKREFPRIPFYNDFFKWVAWGKVLMELHINYEKATAYPLEEITKGTVEKPKAKLKAIKATNCIEIDENTLLSNVPPEAWEYKLGSRCALEWVLDQYKESKPEDPTIAEHFNTYRFADYKEQVIDLLKRVCMVSVETMKIVKEMNNLAE